MMAKRSLLVLTAALLILLVQGPATEAQTNAGLKGVIVDKDGAPIPGATVTLLNSSTGVSQGAVTDAKGEFRITPLPPGKGYTLKVSFPSMATITMDVEISGGRMSTVQITLRPDTEMREQIKVVGRPDLIDAADTSTQTTFSAEFIDALPILGRNYQDVLTLAPGVSDLDDDGNPTVHGSRETDVVTLVDGVSTQDPFSGQRGQELNLDAIEEIEVITSGASAEFGRAQGAFFNVTTKSGGNDFEGKFSFLWRSYVFDGDGSGIDDPRLHGGLGELGLRDLKFNDYTPVLTLSGPIRKDKAWYHFTAEYRQVQEPVNALTQAFVRTERQKRINAKVTWDMTTNHKLQFTATADPQEFFNLGLDSFTQIENGFTANVGGLNLILKETSIFSPNMFLETTVQHFSPNFDIIPTLAADTNGNGTLFVDRNNDGFFDATERDPGEDFDRDVVPARVGNTVVEQDTNGNGRVDASEDIDGSGTFNAGAPWPRWDTSEDRDRDGQLDDNERDWDLDGRLAIAGTGPYTGACEGYPRFVDGVVYGREDVDCDGKIDIFNEDLDGDGRLDAGEDLDMDKRLDNVFEDLNRNGILDGEIDTNRSGGLPDPDEDLNGNGKWDGEDTNRNGRLDGAHGFIEDKVPSLPVCNPGSGLVTGCYTPVLNPGEDRNGNGILDPGEDLGNGILDPGEDKNFNGVLDYNYIEDRNGDGLLNDFVFPDAGRVVYQVAPDGSRTQISPFYPYATARPIMRDRDHTVDGNTGRVNGPYFQSIVRDPGRITLRQDLTIEVPEWHGQHSLKFGGKVERETLHQTTTERPIIFDNFAPPQVQTRTPSLAVRLPTQNVADNEASNTTFAFYANDIYKPLPNLTVQVGMRFEREATDSFGYTPFDPVAQRQLYDRIWNLGGGEIGRPDDVIGNNDGVSSQGFCSDPLFQGLNCGSNPTNNEIITDLHTLRRIAPSRLTQHHQATAVTASALLSLFPEARVCDNPFDPNDCRIDREILRLRGSATFQEREAFRLTNNNLAPRLSVSWDPFADNKTKIFVNWGRFYDKLFLEAIVAEEGPDFIYRYYRKDARGVTASGIPNNGIGVPISKAPPSISQVDRGLQTPFSDELTFAIERELAPEITLGLRFIQKKYRQQLQDTDINHSLRFYGEDHPKAGQPLDEIGATLTVENTFTRIKDNRPDLYIHNFFMNQIFRLGNINQARYKGLELQLKRRLSRKWQMDASYTYGRSIGAAEDFNQDLGDDPATVSSEFSYLADDERHVVKTNFAVFLPRDWQIGWTALWSSGRPYSVISEFTANDNYDFQQFRRVFGDYPDGELRILKRNTLRNNPYYLIDVKAEKALVLGKFNSKLFLNVDNLLNTDVLFIESFEPAASNKGLNLQLDAERVFGRRFEIGMALEF